jgi:hypothetical protein
METTLLTAGLACLIASIIGGGLKAFSIEIPVLTTWPRQIVLFALGLVLCLIAFAMRPLPPGMHGPSTTGPTTSPLPTAKSPPLPAPSPLQPVCGTVIPAPTDGRFLAFRWSKVENASTYTVEVDCFGCNGRQWFSFSGAPWHVRPGLGLRTPLYSSDLYAKLREASGTAIRWRVWAVGQSGLPGDQSPWYQVAFVG